MDLRGVADALENASKSTTPPCLAVAFSSQFSSCVLWAPPSKSRKLVGMRSARKMSFKSNCRAANVVGAFIRAISEQRMRILFIVTQLRVATALWEPSE